MLFKVGPIIVMFMIACGGTSKDPVGVIGEELDDSTSLYNSYGIKTSSLFLVDEPTNRILKVNLETMKLDEAYGLSDAEDEHTLASNSGGNYVIDFSTKHLEIIRSNGEREKRPFDFQGTPVSAAYHPSRDIFVMLDDLQSIGLLLLSAKGEVRKSWLGGSLLDEDKSLLAGDLDNEGQLVLAASDKSIAVVDVEASIDGESWEFESFDSGVSKIYWVAPDRENENLCLILAKDAVAIINVESKVVVEQISLSENQLSVISQSKLQKPHILLTNSETKHEEILFIDEGVISRRELPKTDLDGFAASYLDSQAEELSALFSNDDAHRVAKLRLSDNLVLIDREIESQGDAQLGPDSLFINKKSQLGYLQNYRLSDDTRKDLKGYNFDYFRNR